MTASMLLGESVRHFVAGSEPVGMAMILTAIVNGATNVLNLQLQGSHRSL